MASLNKLPASVLTRIMGYLDLPADVLNLASSCRPALDAFGGEEAKVLLQLLVNCFGFNLNDAVCLATVPAFDAQKGDHKPFNPFTGRESIWSGKVKEFRGKVFSLSPTHQSVWRQTAISKFLGEQLGPGGFYRDMIVRLCKLATMVDGYMSQYIEFFRAMATTQVAIRCHPAVAHGRSSATAAGESEFLAWPSRSERHRIQRAMIRFEMVCRLFTIPYWQMLMATSADKMTRHLAEYGKHDYKVDEFLGLIDQDEVEQILSVAAFVRAQHRCMLGDVRRDFEELARSAAEELFANPPAAATNATKWYFKYHGRCNEAGNLSSVEYLLHNGELLAPEADGRSSNSESESGEETAIVAVAAEEAGVAAGFANIASGFGLGFMGELLGMGKEARRKQLMDLITAVDQGPASIETDAGYLFNFLHVQSFPVVQNNQPAPGFTMEPEDEGPNEHPANGRLVGNWFWDTRRLETEEFQWLYANWMLANSPVPPATPMPGRGVAAQLAGWYGKPPNAVLGNWWITREQWLAITEDFRVQTFMDEGSREICEPRAQLLRAIVNKALGTGGEGSQN